MPNIGPMELIIVLAIALIILGPKKLPDAGRSLGRGLREFKNSVSGGADDELSSPSVAQASATADREEQEPSNTPVAIAAGHRN